MAPWHLKIVALGHTVLDVTAGTDDPPPAAPATEQANDEPADDLGPVTDRRAGPVLGFAPQPPAGSRSLRHGHRPTIR